MLQLTGPAPTVEATKILIAERIRGEFREMPGLTLTVAQAQRLWNVDLSTCTEVLAELVEAGFLCRKMDGTYGRSSDLTARSLRMAKAGMQFVEVEAPRRVRT